MPHSTKKVEHYVLNMKKKKSNFFKQNLELSSELNFISLFSFRFDPLFSVSVMSEPRSYQARSRRLDPESNAPSTFPRTARVGSEPRFQVRKTGKKSTPSRKVEEEQVSAHCLVEGGGSLFCKWSGYYAVQP